MDYARNNYIAQPGDLEKGVKLTPPILGVYDIHAINWGYRLIQGADTPEKEKKTLMPGLKKRKPIPCMSSEHSRYSEWLTRPISLRIWEMII